MAPVREVRWRPTGSSLGDLSVHSGEFGHPFRFKPATRSG